jgi:hypothetical protein
MAEANLNKAHQVLTYLMLPFYPTILAPPQVGGSLPWPDAPMGVEPHVPGSPSLSQEALQEEESQTAKQDQRPSTQGKVPHANLPPTSGTLCF